MRLRVPVAARFCTGSHAPPAAAVVVQTTAVVVVQTTAVVVVQTSAVVVQTTAVVVVQTKAVVVRSGLSWRMRCALLAQALAWW